MRETKASSSRRIRVLLSVLSAMPLLAVRPIAAQDARPGVFGEVLDVRVVNVEVVVTDKKGTRISNLLRDDFELEVDGKAVPIDFFAEVVGGVVEERPAAAGASPPAVEPGRPLGVSWLLFIDDYYTIQRDRNQVLKAMSEQLGHLGPADRMAVVAWDGKRLSMLSSWTGSVRELQRVLAAAQKRPSFGLQRLAERRMLGDEVPLSAGRDARPRSIGDSSRLDPEERQLVDMIGSQVKRSVGAAAATLRAFAQPSGRKAMLLLAGGWPWRPVDFVVPDPDRLVNEVTLGAEPLFSPLTDVANLLGYTLYPVDVPGLSQRTVDAALDSPLGIGDRIAESRREQDLHMALDWLAGTTGGRSFLNERRLAVFEETVTDTRSFYWLGFTPKRSGDDKPHNVRVKMKRPGLEVRSRHGFLDASRRAEVSMAVESALLFGNPASAAPLGLTLGKPERTKGRTMRVPITVAVPLSDLTPLPTAEGPTLALELRVVAQDAEGTTSAIPVMPLQVRVPENVQPGDKGRYETTLLLRRAPHDIVVALYEPVSGKVFSATARVTP